MSKIKWNQPEKLNRNRHKGTFEPKIRIFDTKFLSNEFSIQKWTRVNSLSCLDFCFRRTHYNFESKYDQFDSKIFIEIYKVCLPEAAFKNKNCFRAKKRPEQNFNFYGWMSQLGRTLISPHCLVPNGTFLCVPPNWYIFQDSFGQNWAIKVKEVERGRKCQSVQELINSNQSFNY